MRKSLFGLGFIFTLILQPAFGATSEKMYSFAVDLALDNEVPMKTTIISSLGRHIEMTEEVNGKKRFVEFVATPVVKSGANSLNFQFVVGTIDKNGQRQVRATPQIITDHTSIANMTSANQDETEKVSVSVSWKAIQN